MKELILDFMGMNEKGYGDNLRLRESVNLGKQRPESGEPVIITSSQMSLVQPRETWTSEYRNVCASIRTQCEKMYVADITPKIEGESIHYAVTALPI